METVITELDRAVNAIVDEYRARCLWFLRADYYPTTPDERLRILDQIQRHGDRAAYVRAAELRQCLLPNSNGVSRAS